MLGKENAVLIALVYIVYSSSSFLRTFAFDDDQLSESSGDSNMSEHIYEEVKKYLFLMLKVHELV